MAFAQRIASSFEQSSINRILVVDDAYDPPPVTSGHAGGLLDFLDREPGVSACLEAGLHNDEIDAARKALNTNEYTSPDLEQAVERLFSRFVECGEDRFEPNDLFTVKQPNLDQVQPLVAFLRESDNGAEVKTIGLTGADVCFEDFKPQLILLDYYLNSEADPDPSTSPAARRASMDFLRRVVRRSSDAMPSVVLMSKHDISDVDEYRHDSESSILALRFGFLSKQEIRSSDQSPLTSAGEDVLLDASQGYRFGLLLQRGLDEWHGSVKKALDHLAVSVRDLTVKDLAYLLRFRLRPEASGVTRYVDWLFGENLRGFTECEIPWSNDSLAALEGQGVEDVIEGAHDGPTTAIADLYHRARIAHRQGRDEAEYRLGDIFRYGDSDDLRVVITPDCDLVMRPKGPERVLKAKVEQILTMGGTLSETASKNAVADELLLLDDIPRYVEWNPKDLATFPIRGESSLHRRADIHYVGTFRPVFALSTQNRALVNLARIGLPVAPALGVQAQVDVWVKGQDRQAVRLDPPLEGIATVIPRREGPEAGHRILLRRTFFNELIDRLSVAYTSEQSNPNLSDTLVKQAEEFRRWLLVRGGELSADARFQSAFMLHKPNHSKHGSSLQFVVTMSPHAKQVLRVMDPLE